MQRMFRSLQVCLSTATKQYWKTIFTYYSLGKLCRMATAEFLGGCFEEWISEMCSCDLDARKEKKAWLRWDQPKVMFKRSSNLFTRYELIYLWIATCQGLPKLHGLDHCRRVKMGITGEDTQHMFYWLYFFAESGLNPLVGMYCNVTKVGSLSVALQWSCSEVILMIFSFFHICSAGRHLNIQRH